MPGWIHLMISFTQSLGWFSWLVIPVAEFEFCRDLPAEKIETLKLGSGYKLAKVQKLESEMPPRKMKQYLIKESLLNILLKIGSPANSNS